MPLTASEDLCHGVRTPLTTIANAANLLLYRMEVGNPRRDRLALAELRGLVETILVEVRLADRRVLDTAWAIAADDRRVEVVVHVSDGSDAEEEGGVA